jgi:hypothetical protein
MDLTLPKNRRPNDIDGEAVGGNKNRERRHPSRLRIEPKATVATEGSPTPDIKGEQWCAHVAWDRLAMQSSPLPPKGPVLINCANPLCGQPSWHLLHAVGVTDWQCPHCRTWNFTRA